MPVFTIGKAAAEESYKAADNLLMQFKMQKGIDNSQSGRLARMPLCDMDCWTAGIGRDDEWVAKRRLKMSKSKTFIVEVSYEDTIYEYEVVAISGVSARDLMVRHLEGQGPWKHIRARTTPGAPSDITPRVIRKL